MLQPQSEIEHLYGSQVHLLKNPFLEGILAQLCSPETFQPQINQMVETLYNHLLTYVINQEFPKESFKIATRMTASHEDCLLEGERIYSEQKVICVNIARAGTYPSHLCYQALHQSISPSKLRQDHVFAARATNSEHQVTGTMIGSTKIGGDKDKAIVLVPDPMGATGNTLLAAIKHYKENIPGKADKWIALHLIVTPEYLMRLKTFHPDVFVYALRLDRGLSPKDIQKTKPGTHWALEKGLNPMDYIVPGGGGFGEIMNNSFV